MKNFIKTFEESIVRKPNNFIIIFFNPGMAGSALQRILISHDELHHSFKNFGQMDYDDPIRYPDSSEGFLNYPNHTLSFKEQHLSCAHLNFYTPTDREEDILKHYELIKQGKTIVFKTHDFSLYEKFKKSRCVFVIGNKQLNRGINFEVDMTSFTVPEKVFTVNINSLMSKDYDTFLDEYLKIVFEFDLTPRINSVRSFILMWLERQERLKRTLS